jgi:hypothetical protein
VSESAPVFIDLGRVTGAVEVVSVDGGVWQVLDAGEVLFECEGDGGVDSGDG